MQGLPQMLMRARGLTSRGMRDQPGPKAHCWFEGMVAFKVRFKVR
jgi:hypothetical protein